MPIVSQTRAGPSKRHSLVLAAILLCGCQQTPGRPDQVSTFPHTGNTLAALAVPVTPAQNRAVSFTNKRAAFYYTQTHRNDHPEHAWFRGFNIAGRRIFSDYMVHVGARTLDPATADVIVRPDVLLRRYPNDVTEALRLFDGQDVVEIEVTGAGASEVTLELHGDMLVREGADDSGFVDWYMARQEAGEPRVDVVAVGRRANRFLIAVAPTREAALALLEQALSQGDVWRAARYARLEAVINGQHLLYTSDARLTHTLRWLMLTTDSLVTQQRGDGIYAGLPWFNEYWGRDSFIALPGAALVTGNFEEARAILVSFAQFQDLDRASHFYGRLPNIVKPGSIDYHTTDGTPRWVIALRDYVRYTGDRSIVRELYPNVQASIDGALRNFTDATGYLVHADNETWMDARREPDKVAYSPRSTRANDIQALWHQQLLAGVEFAEAQGDSRSAQRWQAAADRLRASFERDFADSGAGRVADHLDARGMRNLQQRPNALFALPMLEDAGFAARALRASWEALVYPWGVATLDQGDPNFHPYHLAPGRYHKDAAYHNGAVWPWLNGIAMERMLERGQVELAWQLFANTNEIAATRGVVGGLPENLDAYPHPGEAQPRLTGTYLQAWSNAEQLRVWYQGFLGIQPAIDRGAVRVAPRLPAALDEVEFVARVGQGELHARYERIAGGRRYMWQFRGQGAATELDVPPFPTRVFQLGAGDALVVTHAGERLEARWLRPDGSVAKVTELQPDATRVRDQALFDEIFRATRFAQPGQAESHPVMQQNAR